MELPSALRRQDAYLALPAQQALHRLLGLDETRLLRACAGLYSLGQRFSNWSGPDTAFLHAYDTHGISLSHVGFFQYWLKARAQGLKVPLEDFSLGAAAAKEGRFVVLDDATRAFSNATYGYNLGARDYLRAIGKVAVAAGLKHTVGQPAAVETADGRIVALRLRDGALVSGDLFVDSSGPEACLIQKLEAADNFESWSRWLPCDRLLIAAGPVLRPIPAFSQVSAFNGGWLGLFPLMDRTAMIASYGSRHTNAKEVLATLETLSGLRTDGNVVVDMIEPGGRRRPWLGNCVAIGNTAHTLDPLDAVQLHLLHTALSFLVSLFPVDRIEMPEAETYNAKMRSYAAGVRDFQAAHYKLNRRFGEALWDTVRDQEPPPGLARKLRLFEARGVVSMDEHETFQEENWTSIFVGHRLLPRTWDPQVDKVSEQEQIANFQRMLKFIATEVQSMPSLQAHLELNTSPATSDYIF